MKTPCDNQLELGVGGFGSNATSVCNPTPERHNAPPRASTVRVEPDPKSRPTSPHQHHAMPLDASMSGIDALLTFANAARALGVSLRQFRRLVDAGKIAFVKVSERSPRVQPSELRRYLETSTVRYSTPS